MEAGDPDQPRDYDTISLSLYYLSLPRFVSLKVYFTITFSDIIVRPWNCITTWECNLIRFTCALSQCTQTTLIKKKRKNGKKLPSPALIVSFKAFISSTTVFRM